MTSPPETRSSDAAASAVPRRPRGRWLTTTVVLSVLVGVGLAVTRSAWLSPLMRSFAKQSLDRRDFARATGWLDFAQSLTPLDGETALLRARIHRKKGEMNEAARWLAESRQRGGISDTRLNREQLLAMAQSGQLGEAERHLPRMLADPGDDGEEICEAFVIGYMRNQRSDEAFELLRVWIADWPTRAYPYLLRGRLKDFQADQAGAEKDFRQVLQLDPENREASYELAHVLKETNRTEQAIPHYRKSLKDPVCGLRAMVELAHCLKVNGDNTAAHQLLADAVASHPKDLEALRELGRMQAETGDHATAVLTLNRAIEVAPYDDESHYLMAQSLQTLGRVDEAKPHFERVQFVRSRFREMNLLSDALRKNPRDADVLTRMGEILLEVSNPEEGVLRLLSAVDINPRHQKARRLLAEHYDRRAATQPEFRKLAELQRAFLMDKSDSAE